MVESESGVDKDESLETPHSGAAFNRYVAALDREEQAACGYRRLVEHPHVLFDPRPTRVGGVVPVPRQRVPTVRPHYAACPRVISGTPPRLIAVVPCAGGSIGIDDDADRGTSVSEIDPLRLSGSAFACRLAKVSYPAARRVRSHCVGRGRPEQTTTSTSGRPVTNTSRTSGKTNSSLRISSTLLRAFET